MTMNLKCISEWDRCLPQPEELTPLSQKLIPHELACAFNILPPSSSSVCTVTTTSVDVLNASHSAFKSRLQIRNVHLSSAVSEQTTDSEMALPLGQGKVDDDRKPQGIVQAVKEGINNNLCSTRVSQSERIGGALITGSISSCARGDDYPSVSFLAPGLARGLSHLMSSASYMQNSAHLQIQESTTAYLSQSETHLGGTGGSILEAANLTQLKLDPSDETDLAPSIDIYRASSITMSNEEQSARTVKKPRLVWTPQLHKRFVDAVAHLGFNHAVPKTIMQLMNVDGLTRENVASHLQKYRLYLKRLQGFSNEGPSSSDQLFASTPVPPSLAASAHYLVSHHNQHGDSSFGTVQNANLSSILGHPARLVTHGVSFPTLSFSGCNPQPSMLQRASSSIPLINSDLGRECYMPETSSAPGQVLSLFPSGSK